MANRRILQLDSTFVDKKLYPSSSEFTIDVNAQPPLSDAMDVRATQYTPFNIYYRWIWIGNTSLPQFNPISQNAVTCEYTFLTSQRVRVTFRNTLPPPDVDPVLYQLYVQSIVTKSDYFVGCLLVVDQESSLILAYDGERREVTLQAAIGTRVVSGNGYIVNPSQTFPNNIIVLESARILPQTAREFLLIKGLSREMVVEQVRFHKLYSIRSFTSVYRNVVLNTPIEDYRSDDLFLVRLPTHDYGSIRPHNPDDRLLVKAEGILDYSIVTAGKGYRVGELVHVVGIYQSARFIVMDIDNNGGIRELQIMYPGSRFQQRLMRIISDEMPSNESALLHIDSVASFCELDADVSGHVANEDRNVKFLVFFPTFKIWTRVSYFVMLRRIKSFLYFYTDTVNLIELNVHAFYYQPAVYGYPVEWIPYSSFFPNVVMPLVSYHQPVCYLVRITAISLPNLPVCGYNILLADFPYVMITLTNCISTENKGLLITNNPYAQSVNFICPIANIRNPDIVKFVVVRSSQEMTFKFNPTDTLRFRVDLPNGRLLTYASSNIVAPFCGNINPPLNEYVTSSQQSSNIPRIYPLTIQSLISATFTFELL